MVFLWATPDERLYQYSSRLRHLFPFFNVERREIQREEKYGPQAAFFAQGMSLRCVPY
jgi:hypothetical protein